MTRLILRLVAGDRMTIDSSGNTGLGVVPPSTYWGVGNNVGLFTGLGFLGSNGNYAVSLYSNGYRNSSSGFTYLDINGNTSTASGIDLEPDGLIKFRNGTASGTSLPEKMRLETDGDLHVDGNVGRILNHHLRHSPQERHCTYRECSDQSAAA
jgi:hypothetical protein